MPKDLSKVSSGLHQQPAPANDSLRKALLARERFLECHPRLRAYQAEIDSVLDKSGNRQGRIAVLGTLMQAKLLEVQKELYKLTFILQQTVNSK